LAGLGDIALKDLRRFIVSPTGAKHRVFAWMEIGVILDHLLKFFARDDDDFFGVLHSRAHEVWSLRTGTSLEDRPRYTPTTCFETLPLPWPPGTEPGEEDGRVRAVAAAAREQDRLRRGYLDPPGADAATLKTRTLTNLYNARPTWLAHAHAALDRAVWGAYGWDDADPGATAEETILARLLGLNGERCGALKSP